MGLSLWRTRNYRYLLINGYLWSAVLAIGIFSVPPSADSYRLLMALPAALLLAAVGLDQLLDVAATILPNSRLVRGGLAGFVLAGLLAINLWTYWGDFAGRCRYGNDPQTRFASYLGTYLGQLQPDRQVYLLSDDVFRYGTHSSVDFLSRNYPVTNVPDSISAVALQPHGVLVAPPTRADELREWARQYTSGGQFHSEYDCGNLMLLVYQMP
jgi:hypothetical protein